MRSSDGQYLDRLDHMRGWAAMLILVYHSLGTLSARATHIEPPYFLFTWISDGHTGVSMFLVLSGFVLTIINRDVLSGAASISYLGFLFNRFLRIFPLLFFVTSLAITANYAKFTPLDLLPLVTMHLNTNASIGISSEWAVGIEFQCYLLLPVILLAVQRAGPKYLLMLMALFVLMRVALYQSDYVSNNGVFYFSLIGRADQFATGIGAAIVYIWLRESAFRPSKAACAAVIALGLVLLTALLRAGNLSSGAGSATYASGFFTPVFHLTEALLWAAVMIGYLLFPARRIWLGGVWSWIGLVSYSLYLLHTLIIFAVRDVVDANAWWGESRNWTALYLTVAVVIPTTLVASALSYHVIEKPFLEFRRPYRTSTRGKLDAVKPPEHATAG